MRIIKTKIAALLSPDKMPFQVPPVLPTDPKELAELEARIISGLKSPEGPFFWDQVPPEIQKSKNPKMVAPLFGVKMVWNEYIQETPSLYKYVQDPSIKKLFTPKTMYKVMLYFVDTVIEDIKAGSIDEAGFRLQSVPDEIRTRVSERVAEILAKHNAPKRLVPEIIRKQVRNIMKKQQLS